MEMIKRYIKYFCSRLKYVYIIISIIVFLCQLFSCKIDNLESIEYLKEKSFHSEVFNIGKLKIYKENIYLKNTKNMELKFSLTAFYTKDFTKKYNSIIEIDGFLDQDRKTNFLILSGNEERLVTIYFITESWNLMNKTDRLPPEIIKINILEIDN